MRVKLQDVEVLIEVVERQSVTKAAAALHLTQPAVTKRLRRLEEGLGLRLLDRSSRRPKLTRSGEVLIAHGATALVELNRGMAELKVMRDLEKSYLSVGALPSAASSLVPRAIDALLRSHAGVFVRIVESSIEYLLRELESGAVDLIVGPLHYQNTPPWVVERPLFEYSLSVLCRASHPLTKLRSVSLKDLTKEEWIVPPRELLAYHRWRNTFIEAGLELPKHRIETTSTSVTRSLLLESDRLGALPASSFSREIEARLLSVLSIELVTTRRSIGVMRRATAPLTPVVEAFLAHVVALSGDLRSRG